MNYTKEKHQYDMERVLATGNHFNQDTRIQKFNNKSKKKSKRTGEITGELFDSAQMEPGMPIRPITISKSVIDTNQNVAYNPFLDFDLYESKPKIKVSYHDSSNMNFSNVSNFDEPLFPAAINFVSVVNNFAFDFLLKFNQSLKSKNTIVTSPLNIINIFGTVYFGSKDSTEKIIQSNFNFPDKKTTFENLDQINVGSSRQLTVMNLIFVNNKITINNAFFMSVNNLVSIIHFNGLRIEYEVAKVNDTIKNMSNAHICNLITPNMLQGNGILLTSVVYMQPKFVFGFSLEFSKVDVFYGQTNRNIVMMFQNNITTKYFEDNNNQVLEMECVDNLAMGFVLPKYNGSAVTAEQFEYYVHNLKDQEIDIIGIPKVKIETRYRIDNLFKKAGLSSLFESANLGEMFPMNPNVIVSGVVHGVVLNLCETEKIAILVDRNKNKRKRVQFIANHPFLFYIRLVQNNAIVVIGHFS